MNIDFDALNEEEKEILKHAKDLPLELRLKVLESKSDVVDPKSGGGFGKGYTKFEKKKRRRGGPADLSAKKKVYRNTVDLWCILWLKKAASLGVNK